MVTILNSFHTGCFDPIPGSVEIHLFIFVIVVCPKSLPCYFIETTLVILTDTEHGAGKACTAATASLCLAWGFTTARTSHEFR